MSPRFLALLAVVLWLPGLSSQQPHPQAQPGVVRVTTRLVEVSVTAVDSHGNPVPGLSRDEFELYDQGVRQELHSFFEFGSLANSPANEMIPAPHSPGNFSNTPTASADSAQTLTIVLFDQLNTLFSDQANARDQLLSFLRQAPSTHPTAIYLLDGNLKTLQDFTTSTQALADTVSRFQPAENLDRFAATPKPIATGLPTDAFENFIRAREARFYLPERRIRPTLDAFRAISEALAGIPGRKNLIWLSGSFPITVGMTSTPLLASFSKDSQVFERQLNDLARKMSAANIAVYPLDARGVTSLDLGPEDTIPPIAAGINWGSQGPAGTMDAATASAVASPDASFAFTMHEIADWTGGRAFLGSNDLRGEIRQALADGQQNYLLGFYPRGVPWDGKFHQLHIVIKRSGIKLRARKGYFAVIDSPEDQTTRVQQLALTERSPLNATSILFQLRADQKTANKITMVRTRVDVPVQQIVFSPAGEAKVSRISLIFLQKDNSSQPVERLERSLEVRLNRPCYEQAMKHGLRFTTSIPLNPATAEFRILLQDLSSGNIGALNFPVANLPAMN